MRIVFSKRDNFWWWAIGLSTVVGCGYLFGGRTSVWPLFDKKLPALFNLTSQPVFLRHRFTIIAFVDPECPAVAARLPALSDLHRDFAGLEVGFSVAYVDPQGDLAVFRCHAAECTPGFVTIDDRTQRLARHVGATYLSEVVIVDKNGKLRYRGRIDNRMSGAGAARPAATQQDLRNALSKLLAGEEILMEGPKGFGCPLPERVKS